MPAPEPGTRLSHYVIQERIGGGGMGTVYRARDTSLDRDVAIKGLRAEVMRDADRRLRFVQEAKAVSALNHPNIVTVHDIGTEGDMAYMVMEFVDGQPLDQVA
jgi:serine/threonine protein kinase